MSPPRPPLVGTRPPLRRRRAAARARDVCRRRGARQHLPPGAEAVPGAPPVRRGRRSGGVGGGRVPGAEDAEGGRHG